MSDLKATNHFGHLPGEAKVAIHQWRIKRRFYNASVHRKQMAIFCIRHQRWV